MKKINIKVKRVKRIGAVDARPIRIIHSLDGIVDPLDTQKVLKVIRYLSKKINWKNVDYIVGFDSGGIIPSLFLSYVSKKPLLIAYKLKLGLPNRIKFLEPNAARKDIYIYGLKRRNRVVLVDDEIYSGDSMVEAIKELQKRGIIIKDIVCLIEAVKFGARNKIREFGFDLKSYLKHNL